MKARLSAVVDAVQGTHERVTITRNGKPAAVLISPDDLASLEETLEILSDHATVARLREARVEVERGEVLSRDELLDSLPKSRGGRR